MTDQSPPPVLLPTPVRLRIFLYLGILTVLLAFGAPYGGGIVGFPIGFILKNKLHLDPDQVSNFKLLSAIPLYLSFIPGFIRDTTNPLGIKDRGLLLIFGSLSAALYVVFAFADLGYWSLLLAVALLTTTYLFTLAAQNGLSSVLGQHHLMSGQIAAVWQIVGMIPAVIALLIGGALSDALEGNKADTAVKFLFLVGAAIMALIALYGLWRPAAVYDNLAPAPAVQPRLRADFARLIRHTPIYPALLIWLLWQFAPGSDTPLMFFIQDELHGTDAQFGQWTAIFYACAVPTFALYGIPCRRLPLRTLLLWGTLAAVPQFIPLLFAHSITGALIAAIPIGLMAGVATGAYLDLIIRSCPPGLQGTTLMMSGGLYFIAGRFGDRLGTYLYHRFDGFTGCVAAITLTYALILPCLAFVPRRLTATPDGAAPISD